MRERILVQTTWRHLWSHGCFENPRARVYAAGSGQVDSPSTLCILCQAMSATPLYGITGAPHLLARPSCHQRHLVLGECWSSPYRLLRTGWAVGRRGSLSHSAGTAPRARICGHSQLLGCAIVSPRCPRPAAALVAPRWAAWQLGVRWGSRFPGGLPCRLRCRFSFVLVLCTVFVVFGAVAVSLSVTKRLLAPGKRTDGACWYDNFTFQF